jgi:hypothetical protein
LTFYPLPQDLFYIELFFTTHPHSSYLKILVYRSLLMKQAISYHLSSSSSHINLLQIIIIFLSRSLSR